MARRDNSPAISFFSFQDIITSLTGIMFLIVLLLVILLTEMRPGTASAPDPALAELQTKIAENTAELQTLRQTLRQTGTLFKDLKKLDLDTVGFRISQQRREMEKMQMRLCSISEETARNNAEMEKLRSRSRQHKAMIAQQQESAKQQEQELRRLQKIRKRAAETIRNRRRFARITVENRTTLNPVLIECRKDGIRLLEIRSGKVTDLRQAGDSMPERLAALKTALQNRDREQEYYTLLVAPEAFEYAALSGDELGIREEQRGLEFYPDDRTTVFAEETP